MDRENRDYDLEILEAELKKENYRYELALRDGAVNSIVREVVKKITDLEVELEKRRTPRQAAPRP